MKTEYVPGKLELAISEQRQKAQGVVNSVKVHIFVVLPKPFFSRPSKCEACFKEMESDKSETHTHSGSQHDRNLNPGPF